MFLVCDRTKSARAKALREKIFSAGYPCAVSKISEIANYLPLVRILTFTDVFDDVRRTPYDNIRVIALGNGFVNSALNAQRLEKEELLLPELERVRDEFFHVKEEWVERFGKFYDDGIFMAKDFFQVYGNIVAPTEREYQIFRYLQVVSRLCEYVPAERICRFCYPAAKMPKDETEAAKNLAVHVANLNQKCEVSMGYHLIEAKRFIGYRLVKLY